MFEEYGVSKKSAFFSANQTYTAIKVGPGVASGVTVGAKGSVASIITLTDAITGTASAGTAVEEGVSLATLTDDTKVWGVNQLAGKVLNIYSGTGNGHTYTIVSNTTTAITIEDDWDSATAPDATSKYLIGESTDNTIIVVDSLNLSGGFPVDTEFVNGLLVSNTGTAAPQYAVFYK